MEKSKKVVKKPPVVDELTDEEREAVTIVMTNEVAVNGLVHFPDFCKLVLRKDREDSKELLNQAFFKVKTLF